MPIYVAWDDDDCRIVRYTFGPVWQVEEFQACYRTYETMLKDPQHSAIGIIVDGSQERVSPPNAVAALKLLIRGGNLPIAFIGLTPATRIMLETLHTLYKTHRPCFFLNNLERGRSVLYELEAFEQAALKHQAV